MRKELDKHLKGILSLYEVSDEAHNEEHILTVMYNSLKILEMLDEDVKKDINKEILITSAVYHDFGIVYGKVNGFKNIRENHHIYSHNAVKESHHLKDLFIPYEINLIASACLEHRASYKGRYSSIYSIILSDADHITDINTMIERCYAYTKDKNLHLGEDEIFEIVYSHLKEKYGHGGYCTLNLPESEKLQENVKDILDNKEEFREIYKNFYGAMWKNSL